MLSPAVAKQLFMERWGTRLAARHCTASTSPPEGTASWHSAHRLLWVDNFVPEPDHDSGSVRAANLMALLLRQGYHVSLQPVSGRRAQGELYSSWARAAGVQVLPVGPPAAWQLGWAELPPGGAAAARVSPTCKYDLIVVARYYVYHLARRALQRACPGVPVVFDTVDVHFLREARGAAAAAEAAAEAAAAASGNHVDGAVVDASAGGGGSGLSWEFGASHDASGVMDWLDRAGGIRATSLRRQRDAELSAMLSSNMTWVVSEPEKQLLSKLLPAGVPLAVVSNVHALRGGGTGGSTALAPSKASPGGSGGLQAPGHHAMHAARGVQRCVLPAHREGLLFVGNFEHKPNVDAVKALVMDVLPRLLALLPQRLHAGFVVHLVGSNAKPGKYGWAEASAVPVVFHGYLSAEQLALLYSRVMVAVAPLLSGAGVKGKVNAAMLAGVPVVVTPVAAEGMHLTDGLDALIARDPQEFAEKVAAAYTGCELWAALAANGRASVTRHFSAAAGERAVTDAFASLGYAPLSVSKHACWHQ